VDPKPRLEAQAAPITSFLIPRIFEVIIEKDLENKAPTPLVYRIERQRAIRWSLLRLYDKLT